MQFIIRDNASSFYLAVKPVAHIDYLLRESIKHATTFKDRASALAAKDKATGYFEGKYSSLDLEILPMSSHKAKYIEYHEDVAWEDEPYVRSAAGNALRRMLSG